MSKNREPKRVAWSMDPVAADLVSSVSTRTGRSQSAIASELIRRHLLTDYPARQPAEAVDETADALADINIDIAAARIDDHRGYRAAG